MELNVDLTETRPVERRADTILRAKFSAEDDGSILIVESQTEEDKTRRRRWPYYIAFVQDKYECQVLLLVICSSKATARWARKPIEIGEPGAVVMTVAVAGKKWRALMATGTYEFASEQRKEGRVEGEATAVLKILKNRGIPVDKHSHDRISSCTDGATIDAWLARSLTVTTVADLFQD